MCPLPSGLPGFWQGLKDLCFPPACLVCGARLPTGEPLLFCGRCGRDLVPIREPFCRCCGKPFLQGTGPSHFCGRCLTHAWHFTRARAVLLYQGAMAQAIQSFKYAGRTAGLPTFTELRKQSAALDDLAEPELILPVPLHVGRLRERGFNQALLLARRFFPEQRQKIQPAILVRAHHTAPQTGLSGPARRQNIKGAFQVRYPARVKNRRVLLVDDVFTTGATVDECAKVLQRAGAYEVQVITLARVKE
ncbi:MAG: hypothetical protein A2521_06920 [Deltaproteobacteria bacterium RIFOXYD12_FULL_57_12]|nr:MAG: hypothetical protein A2521_06920 [Deltaproteobacteria bacterium RIFOXYD12_FULL_57_12]